MTRIEIDRYILWAYLKSATVLQKRHKIIVFIWSIDNQLRFYEYITHMKFKFNEIFSFYVFILSQ